MTTDPVVGYVDIELFARTPGLVDSDEPVGTFRVNLLGPPLPHDERSDQPLPAAQDVGGAPVDPDPARPTGDVCAAIIATLRYVTGWSMTYDNDGETVHAIDVRDLTHTAADVEQLGADRDVCPVCEEVGCDDDCPLAPYRNAR